MFCTVRILSAFGILFLPIFVKAEMKISSANSVQQAELQWQVCEKSSVDVFSKLNAKNVMTNRRQVIYYDTPQFELFSVGTTIRLRQKTKKLKTAAKVNYSDFNLIPWQKLEKLDFKCELDYYSEKQKVGCSVYFEPANLKSTLSTEQKSFISTETGFSKFVDLRSYGPAKETETIWTDKTLGLDFVLDTVTVDQSRNFIELSTRVPVDEADQSFEMINNWLKKQGLLLCQQQKGRTQEILKALQ